MKNYLARINDKLHSNQKLVEFLLLFVIFLFSMLIRRIGIKHGFPILTHPDEITVIKPVLDMTRLHTLNPGIFSRPDHILDYLNLIFLNVVSFIKYGMNVYWAFDEHYLVFYFYSRLLISIMGSLIPIVAYKIGKEIKPKLALPTAVVFATFPLYIEHSLYITPDIPITLFTLLVTLFALKYLNTKRQTFLIIATAFSAINTAEKYPGLLSLSIVIMAVGIQVFFYNAPNHQKKFQRFIGQTLFVVLVFIVSLFIVAPFLFIEYKSVIQALITEARSTHLGADNLGWAGNMWFYLKSLYANVKISGILLLILGIIAFIKTFDKKNILILYGIFYWIALSILALHWERWALPMDTAPLFLISYGILLILSFKQKPNLVKWISYLIIFLFFFQQGVHSIYTPIRLKYTDTRVVSQHYCDSNYITRENSIYEGYTPLQPTNYGTLFSSYSTEGSNKDFVILSSSMFNRFYAEPTRYQSEVTIYQEIKTNYDLINRFDPTPIATNVFDQIENIIYFIQHRLGLTSEIRYSGPVIEIYQNPK